MRRVVFLMLLVSAIGASSSLAQVGNGGIIVRVPDGGTKSCIDASHDEVYLTIRRFIAKKKSGWFTSDKSVGVEVNTTVNTTSGNPITFPLMSEVTVQDYSSGTVSIPVEYAVVRGFPLTQSGVTYTSFSIDVTIMPKKGPTAWGNALNALVTASKKAPIPNTPIVAAAS